MNSTHDLARAGLVLALGLSLLVVVSPLAAGAVWRDLSGLFGQGESLTISYLAYICVAPFVGLVGAYQALTRLMPEQG